MISLVAVDNKQIQFSMNGEVFIVPRKEIEERFNVYWFAGTLFDQIKQSINKSTDLKWLIKYKT
jgi:hypothetical protein